MGWCMKFFLCVLGLVMFIEGFPYAAFPLKMKTWIIRILEMPSGSLRVFGLVMMAIGLFLISLGTH